MLWYILFTILAVYEGYLLICILFEKERKAIMQENNAKEELIELNGIVEHVTFHSEDTGYSVLEISTDDNDFITAVGIIPFISEGEGIRALGKWEVHGTYGNQFRVEYYEKRLPDDEEAILRYLSSRAVKGIGPGTAAKIVSAFGRDTFEVMEHNPEFLAQINGISMKKALEIGRNFKAQFGMRSVMMFASEFFGPSIAVRIYKRWGSAAIDQIRLNPYILCEEIVGVGFERADRVAQSLGLSGDNPDRIRAAIRYVLQYNARNNGNVYLPSDKLVAAVSQLLSVAAQAVYPQLEMILDAGAAVSRKMDDCDGIYLTEYYEDEKYIASKLDLLEKTAPPIEEGDGERMISIIESENGISYASMQKKAMLSALSSGVMVLTGGPGTGKTTVIRGLIRIFESFGYQVALSAPTGRAAKRMSEATGREAKTIHRMLEMEFNGGEEVKFHRDHNHLLEENVIIVDEVSMVDTRLMAALLRAIKPGAHLLLIGDADQLPAVGAGNVLNDIIAGGRFQTVCLKEIFRQAKQSRIITNAHTINAGEYPILNDKSSDFFFLSREREEDIASTVASLWHMRLPKAYGEPIRDQIQVITPTRKGYSGTENLNSILQTLLNPPSPDKKERHVGGRVFREGDRVMQVRNNYDIIWHREDNSAGSGVYNGDIGILESIDMFNEKVMIRFEERLAEYDFTMLEELEHAYAVTVHKSQGSEYPVVIIALGAFIPKLSTRELLYTAVTRAQKMVIIVGSEKSIQSMVDNNMRPKRYTGLCRWIESYGQG